MRTAAQAGGRGQVNTFMIGFGNGARVAGVAGGVLGGFAGGGLLSVLAPGNLLALGAVVGRPTVGASLAVVVALGAVLGLLFGDLLGRLYVDRVALADTAPTAGFLLGLVAAVALGLFAVPELVNARVFLAWVVYGVVLGVGHRAVFLLLPVPDHRPTTQTETETGTGTGTRVTTSATTFGGGEVTATAVGSVAGGLVGGGLLYVLAPAHLALLGALAGRDWPGGGFGVFLGVAVLFGVLFAVTGARVVGLRAGYARRLAGVGLAYGLVLAVAVGALAVPYLAVEFSPYRPRVPVTNLRVLLGYTAYGLVLGGGYGATVESVVPRLDLGLRWRAAGFGALFGAFLGGLVVHHLAGPVQLRFVGSIVGLGATVAGGWLAWTLLCLLLGGAFARAMGGGLARYADSLAALGSRRAMLWSLLGPLLNRAAVTTTAALLGLGYGIAAAVVVGALLVPLLVATVTPFNVGSFPSLDPFVLLGYVVYGLALGVGYGVEVE